MFLAWAKSSTAVQHSRIHTNDSVEVKYYDRPTNTLDKMAFSITGDLGCEYGGGVSCHKNNPVVGTKGGPKQSFAGWMAYNRFWFKKDLFGLTVGGGVLDNPGRYLTLLPPINGADAISGSPYFPASPGSPYKAWDTSLTFDWMPKQYITFRWEDGYRHANQPYWTGRGGITPPGGNNGSPAEFVCMDNTPDPTGTGAVRMAVFGPQTCGVARVSGRMLLDPYDPARSTFDLVIYPAGGESRGLDGKLATGRFPGAPYTEMSFKSKRIVATSDGNLEATGNLTLTRVDRSVTANPTEDYAGPIYGNPVVHTVNHEVTFRFSGVDSPAVSEKKTATTKLSASARIGYENFPQLSSAMLDTHWPLVVEDENCQVVSTQGEDYAGPTCTGITGPVISRAAAPPNVGEDYHGFEVAPRAGSQVTIEFDLVGTWSGSASQIAATNRPGKADCLAVGGRAAGDPSP